MRIFTKEYIRRSAKFVAKDSFKEEIVKYICLKLIPHMSNKLRKYNIDAQIRTQVVVMREDGSVLKKKPVLMHRQITTGLGKTSW